MSSSTSSTTVSLWGLKTRGTSWTFLCCCFLALVGGAVTSGGSLLSTTAVFRKS